MSNGKDTAPVTCKISSIEVDHGRVGDEKMLLIRVEGGVECKLRFDDARIHLGAVLKQAMPPLSGFTTADAVRLELYEKCKQPALGRDGDGLVMELPQGLCLSADDAVNLANILLVYGLANSGRGQFLLRSE